MPIIIKSQTIYGAPSIVTDGLSLYLDAANTRSYPGTGIIWNDLSGNGNNGTLINGPTFDSGNNGSIVLDGVNDYTNTTFLTKNHFIENQNWTVSSWHNVISNTTSGNGRGGISVNQKYQSEVDPGGFGINIANGNYCVNLTHEIQGGTKSSYELLSPVPINYNTIEHIIATYENTSKTVRIYKNGILTNSSTNSNYKWTPATGNTRYNVIGTSTQGGWGYYFPMKIYNSLIYNRALTAEEILQNYNSIKSRFGI